MRRFRERMLIAGFTERLLPGCCEPTHGPIPGAIVHCSQDHRQPQPGRDKRLGEASYSFFLSYRADVPS